MITPTDPAKLLRLAQHLATYCPTIADGDYCEVATPDGRCREDAVAIRWEHGFADAVCAHHATHATVRGALVVYANRHNGEG